MEMIEQINPIKKTQAERDELYAEAFRLLNRTIEILDEAYEAHCQYVGIDPADSGLYAKMKSNLRKDETI